MFRRFVALNAWPDVGRRRAPPAALRWIVPLAMSTLFGVYLLAFWPWMQGWGATPDERARRLPGDELVPVATDQSTRAVAVRAPAAETWRWLVQVGEDRAGFYSYDWLENLFGARIHNADRVHPEWQSLHTGDLVRAVPPGYLGGALDEMPGWRVAALQPGHWFVLQGWGAFVVEPVDAANSRVIVRTRYRDETWWGPVVSRLAFGPVHFVMERRMLLGIRDRAEGRRPPTLLPALASAGFATAVAGTLALLLRRRHAVLAIAPPALFALGVLWGTGDAVAAAAGFTALGLVLASLPLLRRWWTVLLPVPAVVLLVLLLAPDAFLAFGFAFLGIAAAGATVAWTARPGRTRTSGSQTAPARPAWRS